MIALIQVSNYSTRRFISGCASTFKGASLKPLFTRFYSQVYRCGASTTGSRRTYGLENYNCAAPIITSRRFESITSSTTGQRVPDSVLNLSPTQYRHLADETLDTIATDLEDLFEDKNIADADVDNSAGIVTITTAEGTYVINKQPPNKQIWLSSPISGPDRFDYIKGRWTSLRKGEKLFDILEKEVSDMFGEFEFTEKF
mgnify:CR=1 FL=1